MQKKYIYLIVAVLFAIGVSAKTIYIWHNGIKTDLPIQTNDSITFNEGSSPTMHIWRNGSDIYQLPLAVNDSITYAHESPTPPATTFDYDHWREQTAINIYGFSNPVALPWASASSTTMPAEYMHPEREYYRDSTSGDSTALWQLAFNLCDDPTIAHVDMFGLWNEKSSIMRIYTFIEQAPNENAKYFYYAINSSVDAFVDDASKGWMPAESTIKACSWGNTIEEGLPLPSQKVCELLPITGVINNGQINPGWICFELHLSNGIKEFPLSGTISFALFGVQEISFDAAMTLTGKMEGNGCKMTIPANKAKKAGGIFSAIGNFLSTSASLVLGGLSGGDLYSGVAAGFGIAGAAATCAGQLMIANEAGREMTYNLDLNFDISAKADITGSLSSQLGSNVFSITMEYNRFFEEILKHRKGAQSANSLLKTKTATTTQLGIWNLKRPPVYYVATDAALVNGDIYNRDTTLAAFLDPTSIELELNTDNSLFPYDEIDSVNMLTYDFVFIDSTYNMPTKPYCDYYGIQRDVIGPLSNPAYYGLHHDKSLLLNPAANYECDSVMRVVMRDSIVHFYTGATNKLESLPEYNLMYSPAIRPSDNNTPTDIGVAVLLEIVFKNGDRRLFADRFLPEIKAFNKADAPAIMERIKNASTAQPIGDIVVKNPLYASLRNKAIRVLHPLVNEENFKLIPLSAQQNAIVKPYFMTFGTSKEFTGILLLDYKVQEYYKVLAEFNMYDNYISDCLEKVGMPPLGDYYYCQTTDGQPKVYDTQNDQFLDSTPDPANTFYLIIQ